MSCMQDVKAAIGENCDCHCATIISGKSFCQLTQHSSKLLSEEGEVMFKLLTNLPRHLWVACSGGVDSMAVLDFLSRNHNVSVVYFNHLTAHGISSEDWITRYCSSKSVDLVVGKISRLRLSHESQEEYWRNCRYEFFKTVPGTVVTAHHLDDAVETYLFNCLHGKNHTIPLRHHNVVRPFLTTPKREFENWCERKGVPWIEDASNHDIKHMRNLIRHNIVPEALRVNPGLSTVVKKIVVREFDLCENLPVPGAQTD